MEPRAVEIPRGQFTWTMWLSFFVQANPIETPLSAVGVSVEDDIRYGRRF